MKRRSTFSLGRRSLSSFGLGSDNAIQRLDDTALRELIIGCASGAYGEIVQEVNAEKAEKAKMEASIHLQRVFEGWKFFTLDPSREPGRNQHEMFESMKDMHENIEKFHCECLKWDEILSTMRESFKGTAVTNSRLKPADETHNGFPMEHIIDDPFLKAFKDIILKLGIQEKEILRRTVVIDKLCQYAKSAIIPLHEHAPRSPRTLLRAVIAANFDRSVTDEHDITEKAE